MTDESAAYDNLGKYFKNETVCHAVEFSSDTAVNDNQCESYFSRVRRHVRRVSLRCVPKYINVAIEITLKLGIVQRLLQSGINEKEAIEAPFHCASPLAYLTRFLYSNVRVSISILSPVSQNSGTGSSKPVEMRAGFMTLPEVSPLTAGSV